MAGKKIHTFQLLGKYKTESENCYQVESMPRSDVKLEDEKRGRETDRQTDAWSPDGRWGIVNAATLLLCLRQHTCFLI